MPTLSLLLTSSVLPYVLDYALNAAWQLPVLFAGAWVAVRVLREEGPAVGHRLWSSALAAAVVAPALSSVWPASAAWLSTIAAQLRGADAAQAHANVTVQTGPAWARGSLVLEGRAAELAAIVLLAVTAYFALRLLYSLWKTCELVRRSEPLTLSAGLHERFEGLCDELGIAPPALAISQDVAGPVVVGAHLLLPAGFLDTLAPLELDAALAHELAHVRRRDFALHLALQAVVLPLRWHPLAWVLLARIAASREAACDALAAELLQGPRSYARSLVKLAHWIGAASPAHNPHALGLLEGGSLERRIMQLTTPKNALSLRQRVLRRSLTAALLTTTCGAALVLHLGVRPAAAQTAAPGSATATSALPTISPGVMAGQILSKVQPKYPAEAKAAKVQGTVVLDAVIGKDGAIQHLKVISGPTELQTSALDAVRLWVYKPYLLNGEPTEVATEIRVTYSLGN